MRIGAQELLRRLEARGFADEAAALSERSGAPKPEGVDPGEAPPAWLGTFEIMGELGQGAYGTVLLGLQERPVRRLAAVKLLKRGMDSLSVLARFRAEQQALALMDHPAVATVFESGTAEDGRPWFAMPLVTGLSITQHCDVEGLGLQARLALFLEAARGVHHAHEKGILHRDLKPANILVGVEGERVQPRVIDFGIAKAVEGAEPLSSMATLEGSPLGTPAYMAPEQTRGQADVRSDVWSLGVILGELLAGWRPLDREPARGPDGALVPGGFRRPSQVLRERMRAEPAAAWTAAQRRGIGPSALASTLQGDLDAIVGRCMADEPERRYASVADLLDDITRHLEGRPVTARPPSVAYRARRFARRHRVLMVAGCLVSVALVTATLLSLRAAARAEGEARAAEAVTQFLVEMLGSADPWRPGGQQDLTVREALTSAEKRLTAGSFRGGRLERARLLLAVGLARLQLGQAAESLVSLEEAERELSAVAPVSPAHAESLHRLGLCLQALGRPVEAEAPMRRALAMHADLEGPDAAACVRVMNDLALSMLDAGQLPQSESMLRDALARLERSIPADAALLAGTQGNLGMLLQSAGRLSEAKPFLVASLETNMARLGPEDLELAMDWNNLGLLQKDLGESADAERSLRRSLRILEQGLGQSHPSVALVQVNLADLLHRLRRTEEAIDLLDRARRSVEAAYGDSHPELARVCNLLGFAHLDRGLADRAEADFRSALKVWRTTLGDVHPDVATACNNVARSLQEQGRAAEALPFSDEAVAIAEKAIPESDPRRWVFVGRRGSLLLDLERVPEADAHLRRALAGLRNVQAPASRLRSVLSDLVRGARMRRATGDAAAQVELDRWDEELNSLPGT